ncbi:MAG: antitoxin [Elusimicrobia bacterium RIFCSPLOWO2_02_FULL_39_32]|nr:MAG: antitoxin [Elusimicrobia bacterium GWA2_38_7]OGR79911.1 MAG: antitoxin [Elusimicrobia bacterium RIFCSPHIGHO2_02_FULL_39_36]OGR93446.1 MAG: antitoxin [Elusimicrobia bacterium RIFCSPLOWO2_02_FULL_39_32]OGS00293.1 MAG: antitoxin [Elusimicrobia bacterium RIFCSPLOWO2_12_FULL_39_28]
MSNLNKEEKEILRSIEKGEWKSVPNLKEKIAYYQKVARATMRKNKTINFRISSLDLDGIRQRAFEEGIPYQTLISSIIHKYVIGAFVERVR